MFRALTGVIGWARMGSLVGSHGGSAGGRTQFVHGRSRITVDPRIPILPGRGMSGFHH